jgi:hypothetical protein
LEVIEGGKLEKNNGVRLGLFDVVECCLRLMKVHPHPFHKYHISSHCTTTTSPPGDT